MKRIDLEPGDVAAILATMPVSTVAGLLSPHGEWRERAAMMVAEEIVDRLNRPPARDANQLVFSLG